MSVCTYNWAKISVLQFSCLCCCFAALSLSCRAHTHTHPPNKEETTSTHRVDKSRALSLQIRFSKEYPLHWREEIVSATRTFPPPAQRRTNIHQTSTTTTYLPPQPALFKVSLCLWETCKVLLVDRTMNGMCSRDLFKVALTELQLDPSD